MSELWELVWGKPEVDPAALSMAIEHELKAEGLDFRTRLLIRDSTDALERYWGPQRLQEWLSRSPVRDKIEAIKHEDLGNPGFLFLKDQLMDKTEPEAVRQFLRELGTRIEESVTLEVGGSIALILTGYLSRATTDLDIVDEVPEAIRKHRVVLEQLQKRYSLMLTHFQSHYLPSGWKTRLHDLGSFGTLQVYTVDVYDVFLGKLFSNRAKDLDDLRAMTSRLDKDQLTKQLQATTAALMQDAGRKETAERNWYILFGERLPS
jgi:hypothetical protein